MGGWKWWWGKVGARAGPVVLGSLDQDPKLRMLLLIHCQPLPWIYPAGPAQSVLLKSLAILF